MTNHTESELTRRLEKMEYKPKNETKIFIIDNIRNGGVIEYSEERLELLKAEAVKANPHAPVYVIDIPDPRKHETA